MERKILKKERKNGDVGMKGWQNLAAAAIQTRKSWREIFCELSQVSEKMSSLRRG